MSEITLKQFYGRVKKNYDSLSRYYDLLSGKAEAGIVNEALNLFLPQVSGRILDIGCATGSALLEMQKNSQDEPVNIGLDISFEMCRKAMQKVGRGIVCSNAFKLPFKTQIFNAISMSFTLELFPEKFLPFILKECKRVLASTGRVLIISMAYDEYAGKFYRAYCWAHRKFPGVIDCRPIRAQHILANNGFRVLENRKKDLCGLPVSIVLAKIRG